MSLIHHTNISTFVVKNECVEITIHENASFELEQVKEHYRQIYAVIKKTYPQSIIDFSQTKFPAFPRETMEYMAKNEYTSDDSAVAIVINGLAQKIIGNFYLKVTRPKRKTKLFTNKHAALKWLNSL